VVVPHLNVGITIEKHSCASIVEIVSVLR